MVKRQKASQRRSFFAQPGLSFQEAFPTVANLAIEVTETGCGQKYQDIKHTRTYHELPAAIDCSNYFCVGGAIAGHTLARIVREMVAAHHAFQEIDQGCEGREGSPKGQRKYGPCINHFELKISIRYVSSGQKSEG
jgi:hypothetical protein